MSPTDPHEPALSILHCWLTGGDGERLAATWTRGDRGPHAVAIINAATGVPRGYYQPFANWLARRGYRVLSYDYRGIGDSLHGPIRDSRATMADWARYDMDAAIDAASCDGLPLLVIGHSAGGNLLGLVPNLPKVAAILTIGAQNAHWRYWPAAVDYADSAGIEADRPLRHLSRTGGRKALAAVAADNRGGAAEAGAGSSGKQHSPIPIKEHADMNPAEPNHTMQAVVLHRHGGPEVLTLAAMPLPRLKRGQVLVRVRASCVNPRDWLLREGRYVFRFILGFEAQWNVKRT